MEDEVSGEIHARAAEYGVELVGEALPTAQEPLAAVTFRRGSHQQQVFALFLPRLDVMDLGDMPPTPPGTPLLMIGPRVTPRNAERLRAAGLNFIDAHGNAYLAIADTLIDVRGRTGNPIAASYHPPAGSMLFTNKRAQVIFAIISWPELLEGRLRDLAAASGVSVGFVQKTLILLESTQHLERHGKTRTARALTDIDRLIEGWVAAFPSGLGAQSKTRTFRGDFVPTALEDSGPAVYLSGEAVAPWIHRNPTWTLYVDDLPRDAIRAGRWSSASREPNIFVRSRFWQEPDGDAVSREGRVRTAPPLLVYADLLASGDSRQKEAARYYRNDNVRLQAR
jgi:hypothetical protein